MAGKFGVKLIAIVAVAALVAAAGSFASAGAAGGKKTPWCGDRSGEKNVMATFRNASAQDIHMQVQYGDQKQHRDRNFVLAAHRWEKVTCSGWRRKGSDLLAWARWPSVPGNSEATMVWKNPAIGWPWMSCCQVDRGEKNFDIGDTRWWKQGPIVVVAQRVHDFEGAKHWEVTFQDAGGR